MLSTDRPYLEMDKENSKLYVENCQMMFENERLRKVAEQLEEEKAALMNELRRKITEAIAAQTNQIDKLQLDTNDSGTPSTSTSSTTVTANKKGSKSRTKKHN